MITRPVSSGYGSRLAGSFAGKAAAGGGTTVTPDVGSISITGLAPTIAQPKNVTPAVGSIAITGYAPSVARTENQAVVPGVGSITITGYAPTVVQTSPSQNITPDVGSITITGYAPTVTQTRATQSEGGGWMPPRGRRKTRKEVYAERVKLGILPPAIVRAAEKVAVVAETVAEFKADHPRYEEMFMRELNVTKWAPSYTNMIMAQLVLLQEEEDLLLLM